MRSTGVKAWRVKKDGLPSLRPKRWASHAPVAAESICRVRGETEDREGNNDDDEPG
jgi:hypothetical protein